MTSTSPSAKRCASGATAPVRYPLLVCDEIGYIPFDPQAANLMFMLISRRYEQASLIVSSNKNFSLWGEIFGDDTVATAMIDRLVHHAEIISLKGESYRLKNHDLGTSPTPEPRHSLTSPSRRVGNSRGRSGKFT